MVTAVSTTDQAACLSASNNTKKTSTQCEIVNTSSNHIEDTYVPSFDIKGTGSEFYTEHSSGLNFLNLSTSLEGFTNGLRMQLVQDYTKQHPDSSVDYCGHGDDVTVYSKVDNNSGVKDHDATGTLKSYLDSIDYRKEYEEYKQSRGCATDEELEALNQSTFQTKDQLLNWAQIKLTSPNLQKDLSNCGVNATSSTPWGIFSNKESDKILSSTSLKDIANYWTADGLAQNFKEQVSAFQSFIDKAATSSSLDSDIKGKITGLSKQITNASDAIEEFSKKREEEIAARHNIAQYNASLIANYTN